MNNFTKKIKLSRQMIIICVIFLAIALFLAWGVIFLLSNTIYMEDNTVMPSGFKLLITVVVAIVTVGIFIMIFGLISRLVTGRGAMTLKDDGIYDTFVMFNFLAFYTTFNIRFIPWDALESDVELSQLGSYRILNEKIDGINAGKLAILILRISGFNISIGKIKAEEFESIRMEHINEA